MKHIKLFKESSTDNWYDEIRPANIVDIANVKGDIIDLNEEDKTKITNALSNILDRRPGTNNGGPVFYGHLDTNVTNRRSGYCWFIKPRGYNSKKIWMKTYKDIYINKFNEDWFLVCLQSSSSIYQDLFYIVDTIEGVIHLIKDELLD